MSKDDAEKKAEHFARALWQCPALSEHRALARYIDLAMIDEEIWKAEEPSTDVAGTEF